MKIAMVHAFSSRGGGGNPGSGPKRQPQARHTTSKLTLSQGPVPSPMVKTNCILGMGVGDGSGLESIQIIILRHIHVRKNFYLSMKQNIYLSNKTRLVKSCD